MCEAGKRGSGSALLYGCSVLSNHPPHQPISSGHCLQDNASDHLSHLSIFFGRLMHPLLDAITVAARCTLFKQGLDMHRVLRTGAHLCIPVLTSASPRPASSRPSRPLPGSTCPLWLRRSAGVCLGLHTFSITHGLLLSRCPPAIAVEPVYCAHLVVMPWADYATPAIKILNFTNTLNTAGRTPYAQSQHHRAAIYHMQGSGKAHVASAHQRAPGMETYRVNCMEHPL